MEDRARAWDAAHPREPHCAPCQPAVGSGSTPAPSRYANDRRPASLRRAASKATPRTATPAL